MIPVIETDEAGQLMLPAELLGEVRPHSRYTIETMGDKLILEREAADVQINAPKLTPDEWLRQWQELAQEGSAAWKSDKSAMEELTDMRNARGQGIVSDH